MRKVITETNRLKMVTTLKDDIEFLHKHIYGNKQVIKYTTGRVFSLEETKKFVEKMFTFSGLLGFAPIINKSTGKMVGHGGILQFDYYNDTNHYEFGYIFEQSSWGLGYATEIALGQIETIKNNFVGSTIFATAHPKNIASKKVLTNVGMQFKERVQKGSRGLRDIYI